VVGAVGRYTAARNAAHLLRLPRSARRRRRRRRVPARRCRTGRRHFLHRRPDFGKDHRHGLRRLRLAADAARAVLVCLGSRTGVPPPALAVIVGSQERVRVR